MSQPGASFSALHVQKPFLLPPLKQSPRRGEMRPQSRPGSCILGGAGGISDLQPKREHWNWSMTRERRCRATLQGATASRGASPAVRAPLLGVLEPRESLQSLRSSLRCRWRVSCLWDVFVWLILPWNPLLHIRGSLSLKRKKITPSRSYYCHSIAIKNLQAMTLK